jgi:hypothetical protein
MLVALVFLRITKQTPKVSKRACWQVMVALWHLITSSLHMVPAPALCIELWINMNRGFARPAELVILVVLANGCVNGIPDIIAKLPSGCSWSRSWGKMKANWAPGKTVTSFEDEPLVVDLIVFCQYTQINSTKLWDLVCKELLAALIFTSAAILNAYVKEVCLPNTSKMKPLRGKIRFRRCSVAVKKRYLKTTEGITNKGRDVTRVLTRLDQASMRGENEALCHTYLELAKASSM